MDTGGFKKKRQNVLGISLALFLVSSTIPIRTNESDSIAWYCSKSELSFLGIRPEFLNSNVILTIYILMIYFIWRAYYDLKYDKYIKEESPHKIQGAIIEDVSMWTAYLYARNRYTRAAIKSDYDHAYLELLKLQVSDSHESNRLQALKVSELSKRKLAWGHINICQPYREGNSPQKIEFSTEDFFKMKRFRRSVKWHLLGGFKYSLEIFLPFFIVLFSISFNLYKMFF